MKYNVWFEDAETCSPPSIIEIYEGTVWGTARSTAKRGQIEEVSTQSVFRVVDGKTGEAVLPGGGSCATERWLNYGFGIRNILSIWMKWCLASDLE